MEAMYRHLVGLSTVVDAPKMSQQEFKSMLNSFRSSDFRKGYPVSPLPEKKLLFPVVVYTGMSSDGQYKGCRVLVGKRVPARLYSCTTLSTDRSGRDIDRDVYCNGIRQVQPPINCSGIYGEEVIHIPKASNLFEVTVVDTPYVGTVLNVNGRFLEMDIVPEG